MLLSFWGKERKAKGMQFVVWMGDHHPTHRPEIPQHIRYWRGWLFQVIEYSLPPIFRDMMMMMMSDLACTR